MEIKDRKRVIFWVRIGLILATIMFVVSWIGGRVTRRVQSKLGNVSVETKGPNVTALGPGDVQILTTDGNFDVTLTGDKIMAGLSQKMVEKVRADIAKETDKEQSGLGAVIAGAVKSSVASAIGIHITYALANVREVRFESGRIVVVTNDGEKHSLSGDTKTDNRKEQAVFDQADAERFIEAVNARKKELGLP